ncbi:hypothetical protein [Fodinicola feengrottensis]|uniref:Uncharacterized protein n=1 Tax=Fodinicola feengrottensis TaxID=435914 RepID=A0ABN2ILS3_9ACTN|nr:hypothetical protein [Fodinicola feengrottensis]
MSADSRPAIEARHAWAERELTATLRTLMRVAESARTQTEVVVDLTRQEAEVRPGATAGERPVLDDGAYLAALDKLTRVRSVHAAVEAELAHASVGGAA